LHSRQDFNRLGLWVEFDAHFVESRVDVVDRVLGFAGAYRNHGAGGRARGFHQLEKRYGRKYGTCALQQAGRCCTRT
jgi:hypothetical protein